MIPGEVQSQGFSAGDALSGPVSSPTTGMTCFSRPKYISPFVVVLCLSLDSSLGFPPFLVLFNRTGKCLFSSPLRPPNATGFASSVVPLWTRQAGVSCAFPLQPGLLPLVLVLEELNNYRAFFSFVPSAARRSRCSRGSSGRFLFSPPLFDPRLKQPIVGIL